MRSGCSPALRHVKRTHGVCVRWLAERFSNPLYRLFYERSALQAADIYTKGFTIPSEWDRVTRLINVLDPARFWEGDDAAEARPGRMPEEHKGGVVFGYRTPNPWQGRESMTIPDPDIDPEGVPAAACTIPCSAPPNPDAHIPWFIAAPCCKSRGVDKEIADRDCALGAWFGESPDYDDEDYASTVDPGSDTESLSDVEEDHTVSVSSTSPITHPVVLATTTTPDPAGHSSPLCGGGGIQSCQFSRGCSSAAGDVAPKGVMGGADPPATRCSPATPRPARRIVEYCCHPDSVLGSRAPAECEVIRLTADDDLTTPGGHQKALDAVSVPGIPVLLYGSIPCTGGSTYQYINWCKGPATRTKIRKHWAVFNRLWRNFRVVADACIANGGRVAIEWPKSCAYWRHRKVQSSLRRWGCIPYHLDGCMYGLTSQAAGTRGIPLRKSWTIASNAAEFEHVSRTCDGNHSNARIQGSDTRMTEGYTPGLADRIHYCWSLAGSSSVAQT